MRVVSPYIYSNESSIMVVVSVVVVSETIVCLKVVRINAVSGVVIFIEDKNYVWEVLLKNCKKDIFTVLIIVFQ